MSDPRAAKRDQFLADLTELSDKLHSLTRSIGSISRANVGPPAAKEIGMAWRI